jgi:hypothetical protein
MATITLRNDFHNTRATIRYQIGDVLSVRRVRDLKRRLCPPTGCTCSGQLGTRSRDNDHECAKAGIAFVDGTEFGTVKIVALDWSK